MKALHQLLTTGEAALADLRVYPAGRAHGLWGVAADGKRAVAGPALVTLWSAMPDAAETVAALAALEDRLRPAWLRVAAARVREAGARGDAATTCTLVGECGAAAAEILAALPQATLAPTGAAEEEHALLGQAADNAVVVPRLFRALAATAGLPRREFQAPPDLIPLDLRANWVSKRLIRLPDAAESAPPRGPTAVLSGCWAALDPKEADRADVPHEALLRWVIERPWPLLLAQLVFAQETWAAERLNGGLALEVTDPSSHLEPPRVEVVVTLPDGREAHCGSLAALLPRALGMLGLAILAPVRDHATLDARLAPLIGELVRRKVWSFEGRGGGRRRPGYAIADDFGSACLRIFGSTHFYRAGDPIARALRQAADSLARERLDGAASVQSPQPLPATRS